MQRHRRAWRMLPLQSGGSACHQLRSRTLKRRSNSAAGVPSRTLDAQAPNGTTATAAKRNSTLGRFQRLSNPRALMRPGNSGIFGAVVGSIFGDGLVPAAESIEPIQVILDFVQGHAEGK